MMFIHMLGFRISLVMRMDAPTFPNALPFDFLQKISGHYAQVSWGPCLSDFIF